jgi:hypothetical protein
MPAVAQDSQMRNTAGLVMINSDRGQQAALDITNYILDKIPGWAHAT